MAITTEKFAFESIIPKYAEDRRISQSPRRKQVVGIESADVTCLECGEQWRSSVYGEGKFLPGIGTNGAAYIFQCPECDQQEAVSARPLMESLA